MPEHVDDHIEKAGRRNLRIKASFARWQRPGKEPAWRGKKIAALSFFWEPMSLRTDQNKKAKSITEKKERITQEGHGAG